MESGQVTVLGIDAGGTFTRARAVTGAMTVHAATGGAGNPLTVSPEDLVSHYNEALEGCPVPAVVAVCAAGAGSVLGRERLQLLLAERFPTAEVHVFPDYVGAWMAAPSEADLLVIAGTGSVVCSRNSDGGFEHSGGYGWILGDHGSAARLGRALLESFCVAPKPQIADDLEVLFGSSAPEEIAVAVHSARTVAPLLAAAAPVVTRAADRGELWAEELVVGEMRGLAKTVVAHSRAHLRDACSLTVALAGGVWESQAAQRSFVDLLGDSGLSVAVMRAQREAIEGAVRLAVELSGAAGGGAERSGWRWS